MLWFRIKCNIHCIIRWQIWKETEPELFWHLEKYYKASTLNLGLTSDENVFLIQLQVPADGVEKVEDAYKDGTLGIFKRIIK